MLSNIGIITMLNEAHIKSYTIIICQLRNYRTFLKNPYDWYSKKQQPYATCKTDGIALFHNDKFAWSKGRIKHNFQCT